MVMVRLNEINRQDGKVFLITGANSGLGYETSKSLLERGATVIMSCRDLQKGKKAKQELLKFNFSGKIELVELDLSDLINVKTFAESIRNKFEYLDVLINNAGVTQDNILPRMKEDEWLEVIQTNLTGSFYTSQRAIKLMMKNKWGRIVFISSVVGLSGNQGQANYAASKAGLIGLAKSISKEMGSRNITSNVVAPGYIETDMTSFLDDQNKENIIEQLSIKRIGKPEDISNIVSFLCNDESEYITGQVIPVDGGLTT